MEDFASKVLKIAREYLLPNASEIREPLPKVLQAKGKVKFGKGYKKSTKFYATMTPSVFLVSVNADENGANFLKLLKRILGEPNSMYKEKANNGRDVHYISEWIFPGFENISELDLHRLFTGTLSCEIKNL